MERGLYESEITTDRAVVAGLGEVQPNDSDVVRIAMSVLVIRAGATTIVGRFMAMRGRSDAGVMMKRMPDEAVQALANEGNTAKKGRE